MCSSHQVNHSSATWNLGHRSWLAGVVSLPPGCLPNHQTSFYKMVTASILGSDHGSRCTAYHFLLHYKVGNLSYLFKIWTYLLTFWKGQEQRRAFKTIHTNSVCLSLLPVHLSLSACIVTSPFVVMGDYGWLPPDNNNNFLSTSSSFISNGEKGLERWQVRYVVFLPHWLIFNRSNPFTLFGSKKIRRGVRAEAH